ncbi:MAG: hypothetical protein AB7R77_26530 [Ilumatobacteraceae bacterium]
MSVDHLPSQAAGASRTPDLQGVMRRQWPIIVLCGLLATAITTAYIATSKVTYEAKATVQLTALPGEVAPGGGRERTLDVETQALVARSTALLETVGDRLDLTAAQVRSSSNVEAAPTGDVLYIEFEDEDAEFAAQGALAYAEEFLAQRKATADNAAKRQKDLLNAQINALNDEIARLTTLIQDKLENGESADPETGVYTQSQTAAIRDLADAQAEIAAIDDDLKPGNIIVDPRTSVNRTGLRVGFTIGGGLAVGLLVGVIVAYLRDRRDDRYGAALGLESMGVQEVGRVRYPTGERPTGGRVDTIRRAYARLLVRLNFSPTTTSAHSRSILLLAVESATLPPNAVRLVTNALAAEGPDNGLAAAVLASDRGQDGGDPAPFWSTFTESLQQANRENDIVLVTAGSFDRSVAGLSIASKVDQVVLLVSLATPVSELLTAIEDLQSVDAHEVGVVVLTRVPSRRRWA